MNGKKARKLRQLVNCNLGRDTDQKQSGYQQTGSKLIGQIHHDGKLTEREQEVLEARTTEERYLYRQLKLVLSGSKQDAEIREQLLNDLAELTAKTKTEAQK